jgi:hypothetical protein
MPISKTSAKAGLRAAAAGVRVDGSRPVTRTELGIEVADVSVDRVDRDVEILRDFCPRQVCKKKSQDAQFAGGELLRVGSGSRSVLGGDAPLSWSTMSVRRAPWGRLVVTEHAEQLRGFGHGKREDQPIGLGGRESCLGSRCRGVSIAQA